MMSLVENLARRQHSPLDLMREIGALRERGYSMGQIAAKTDFSDEYISAICYLLDHGERPTAYGRGSRRDSGDASLWRSPEQPTWMCRPH